LRYKKNKNGELLYLGMCYLEILKKKETVYYFIQTGLGCRFNNGGSIRAFNTGFSVFKNSKTGIPVLKPVLKFLMYN
jgi:hypothetical protein